jgi:flagellar biosynthetic protein FliO
VRAIGNCRIHLFAAIWCIIIGVSAGAEQPQNAIGAFDIEKVQRAIAGAGNADTATGAVASEVSPVKKSDSVGGIAMRICLYLSLIIGAIIAVVWGIKRLGLAGRSKIGGGSMDIMEALPIGQNRAIMLIRVMDKVYVLAQTQNSITLLDKIEGAAAVELISSSKGAISISQFKDVFNGFMEKIKKPV